MYTGLVHLHNLLRWIILILIVIAIVRHFSGMNQKRGVNAGDKKIDLFLMISAHITLILGLVQWFVGDFGLKLIQNAGMSTVMKESALRFWAVEHITGMIIAIVLITIGRGKVKRAVDYSAHKKAFTFFLLALIIILASVPWPFREAVARPWFPGVH
jgi:hypothetical protein